MPYPAFEDIVRGERRNSLLIVRRSVLSLMPRLILFGFAVIILFVVNLYVASFEGIPLLGFFSPRWLALIPLLILLDTMRIYYNDSYVFADSKVTRHQGQLSLTASYPSVRYADIRGIAIHQTFWGRVFNYGSVEVGTAAQAGDELTIEAVDDPKAVAAIIESFRDYNRARARGTGEQKERVV